MKQLLPLLLYAGPAFCQPPSGRIVFTSSNLDGSNAQLIVVNSDGRGRRQLTEFTGPSDLPDNNNTSIVFRHVLHDRQWCDIKIMHLSGTDTAKCLIHDKVVCYPKWQPNGGQIAYEYYRDTVGDIWIMDSLGKYNRSLIKNARHPCWTADGKKILFTRSFEVYLFDLKTQVERQLTFVTSKGIRVKMPVISPDEQTIAFMGFDSSGMAALYTYALNGDGIVRRFDNCDKANWTNDPRYLVASCQSGVNRPWQIDLIDITTGEKRIVIDEAKNDYDPCWISISR